MMNQDKYIVRIFKKVFSEGSNRYWFDIPKYISIRDSLSLNATQMKNKVELAEEDQSKQRSVKSIIRVNKFCEGDVASLDGKDQSVTIETIKVLGKALCNDEYAFLILIEPQNILQTMELLDNIVGKSDLKYIYSLMNKIIYELESSSYYSYKPGTEEDGSKYYDERLQRIREEIDSRFWNKKDIRKKLYRIVEEEEELIKSYSVPGAPERWIKCNPKIKFFDCVFNFIEDNPELYEKIKSGKLLTEDGLIVKFNFCPTKEECIARKEYFENIEEKNKSGNLNYSIDRLYQNELANTLVNVFKNDFNVL